jgi:hypothetical protein
VSAREREERKRGERERERRAREGGKEGGSDCAMQEHVIF